jgi:hypothetical protein
MWLIRMLISTTTASRTTTLKVCVDPFVQSRLKASAPVRGWVDSFNMELSIAFDPGESKTKLNN